MGLIVFVLFAGFIIYLIQSTFRKRKSNSVYNEMDVKQILDAQVDFYQALPSEVLKMQFVQRAIHFMQSVKFTSVGNAKHQLSDEVLVAASAIIPIFAFPNWEYHTIHEVLFYEDNFTTNFEVGDSKPVMGMVGEGAMNKMMILSLEALRDGFYRKDASHTAIHEFIHLIDKSDGVIDGVPMSLIPQTFVEPWLRHIRDCMKDIREQDSNLNDYAGTNEAEFFAVLSEYFFEKPQFLQRHHPVLYNLLNQIFQPNSIRPKA
jgi:hypothetical protein